jgi:hypothetical protein
MDILRTETSSGTAVDRGASAALTSTGSLHRELVAILQGAMIEEISMNAISANNVAKHLKKILDKEVRPEFFHPCVLCIFVVSYLTVLCLVLLFVIANL